MTTIPYPDMLAKGISETDLPPVFDLFAGDAPVTTTQDQAGGAEIPQFTVCGRNAAGRIVALADGHSTGLINVNGVPTADDTVTIGSTVITWKASGAAGNQVNVGADAATSATALKNFINANSSALGVEATSAAGVVTVKALERGLNGDAIALAESGTNTTVSGAALTGGDTDKVPEAKAVRIAAQTIHANSYGPTYSGGIFNHEALIFPPSINTLDEKKAVFDGTPIGVGKLL